MGSSKFNSRWIKDQRELERNLKIIEDITKIHILVKAKTIRWGGEIIIKEDIITINHKGWETLEEMVDIKDILKDNRIYKEDLANKISTIIRDSIPLKVITQNKINLVDTKDLHRNLLSLISWKHSKLKLNCQNYPLLLELIMKNLNWKIKWLMTYYLTNPNQRELILV